MSPVAIVLIVWLSAALVLAIVAALFFRAEAIWYRKSAFEASDGWKRTLEEWERERADAFWEHPDENLRALREISGRYKP